MTRRILASFLAVLVAVITAITLPLGLIVTGQQRRDFVDSARTAARGVAGLAEEQLDDRASIAALPGLLSRAVRDADAVVVLDRAGTVVATAGRPLPAAVVAAVRDGQPVPAQDGEVVVTARVGDGRASVGTIILARNSASLHDRARALWLALGAAALLALVVGAAVGWSLGRWIARPLRSLHAAARSIGAGQSHARADEGSGPADVREVAHAFNEMADRVGALLQNQRGMTAEVSHQLRTPLSALRLRLELLAEDVTGDARVEATAMLTEVDRLARLVDGLLAIARAEATEYAPVSTDLVTSVSERLRAWEPVAAERDVSLDLHAAESGVLAALTPGHLEQVLDNLLANALDAVPFGGRVTVTVARVGPRPVLRVDDTGPGMSAAQRARAFDAYATDRGGRGGTGLGLAIVGRLVATDHGSACLLQGPEGGTRAEIVMQPG